MEKSHQETARAYNLLYEISHLTPFVTSIGISRIAITFGGFAQHTPQLAPNQLKNKCMNLRRLSSSSSFCSKLKWGKLDPEVQVWRSGSSCNSAYKMLIFQKWVS